MNFKENFPVLSGEPQGRVKLESKDLKNKDSLIEKLKKGGRKYAAPIIATLISMGAIKESKSQSNSKDIKRVVSMDQVLSSEGKVAFQENDSTVHLYDVKKRGNGTVKMKDMGTIKTTKGDAVKIGDVGKIDIPEKPGFENKRDEVLVGDRKYEPYHGSVAPKNADGTTKPGFKLINGQWFHVVENGNSERKSEDKTINIEGKKYTIFYPTADEHPTDEKGNIKPNYKYKDGKWYKLVKDESGDQKKESKKIVNWEPFYPTADERPIDDNGKIKTGYKIENGKWFKQVK